MTTLQDIPVELLRLIFLGSHPAYTVLFKRVSKLWYHELCDVHITATKWLSQLVKLRDYRLLALLFKVDEQTIEALIHKASSLCNLVTEQFGSKFARAASIAGHLNIIEWCVEHCEFKFDMVEAVESDNLRVVELILEQDPWRRRVAPVEHARKYRGEHYDDIMNAMMANIGPKHMKKVAELIEYNEVDVLMRMPAKAFTDLRKVATGRAFVYMIHHETPDDHLKWLFAKLSYFSSGCGSIVESIVTAKYRFIPIICSVQGRSFNDYAEEIIHFVKRFNQNYVIQTMHTCCVASRDPSSPIHEYESTIRRIFNEISA